MILLFNAFTLTICPTAYNRINPDIRLKYPIEPYAPNAYLYVQNLKRPIPRFRACFGRGGTEQDFGDFADQRTAALVSTYALKTGKNMTDVYNDLNLIL